MEQMATQQQAPTMGKRQLQALYKLIDQYKQTPDAFSNDEIAEIKSYADAAGVPFEPNFSLGRSLGNLAFEAADSAAFGLLPDEWKPAELTGADKIGGFLGNLLGLAVPLGVGGKVASKGMQGIAKLASSEKKLGSILGKLGTTKYGTKVAETLNKADISKLSSFLAKNPKITKYAMQGAFVGGTNNFFEEGISPLDALLGAAGGAAIGKYGSKIRGLSSNRITDEARLLPQFSSPANSFQTAMNSLSTDQIKIAQSLLEKGFTQEEVLQYLARLTR